MYRTNPAAHLIEYGRCWIAARRATLRRLPEVKEGPTHACRPTLPLQGMSSMEDGHYGRVRFVHGPSDSPRCADPRQEDEATRTMGPPARARGGASERACSGHIESIELVNFMCHRHLLINLNPHINFIIGNNGSGKSAILSALTICLGGRASITQRATSLDSLIREGASSGKIRLKLNNEGDNPYEPSVFGRHIFIERNLRRDGGNSYAILNESGGQVSARKDDINSICDHFGIQVDNPLAVLTQEVAKKFLASAKPRELYEFFMKATQLEQLSVDYTYALERLNESRSKLGISQNVRSTWIHHSGPPARVCCPFARRYRRWRAS